MHGTFILATVGTSLLTNVRRALGAGEGLPARQEAVAFLKGCEPTEYRAGAEINSLSELLAGRKLSAGTTGPPFELVFLVSETTEGQWSGEVLSGYYAKIPGVQSASTCVVEGLTPDDPARFAHKGLRALIRESCALLEKARRKDLLRVINATGGFKAQISFAGLIGQTLGVPVTYQFETFPRCIEMPPMPVDFDREVWLQHYDLFIKLSTERSVLESRFPGHGEIDPVIAGLLDVVEEEGERLYTLSPILELMHQGFLVRVPRDFAEPPPGEGHPAGKVRLMPSELPHHPKSTETFAARLARTFPWIREIKDNTPRMNSSRTHLLPPTQDPAVHNICYSDGEKGVRLSVRTTCEQEGHVAYVRRKLAEFCGEV